jgi:hypothetical protein
MSRVRDPSPAPDPLSCLARHSACSARSVPGLLGAATTLSLEAKDALLTGGARTVRMLDYDHHQPSIPAKSSGLHV